ncbi:MraY family glycosyltransferase [Pseudomonas sp. RT4P38]
MILWCLLLSVFAVSWALTLLLRRYALAKSLMDVPNERSSHSIPTPRGGGVAIVVAFILALPILSILGAVSWPVIWGLIGSGLLVAVIGFADDHGHIAARWRLLGHFAAAAWALFWLNGLPPIDLFGSTVDLGVLGNLLAVIYLVWTLNLYNFMDGIDGLASTQAIFVCAGAGVISWISGHDSVIWAPLLLTAAVAGFLVWNYPPARIFMGDAGSGFLGLVIGILTIQAAWEGSELMWSWLILLGVFTVDATITLLRRLIRKEKIYQAHRSHAYQQAARHYSSHKTVTLGVVGVNLLWVLPMAFLVGTDRLDGFTGLLLTYAPLIWLAIKFDAGVCETK